MQHPTLNNQNKDAWMVGFTPSVSTAVWVGTDTSEPIKNAQGRPVYGRMLPGSIWQGYMNAATRGTPVDQFSPFVPMGTAPSVAPPGDPTADPDSSSGDDSDKNSDDSDKKKHDKDKKDKHHDDSDSSDGSGDSDGSGGSDSSDPGGSGDDNAVFGRPDAVVAPLQGGFPVARAAQEQPLPGAGG